ncbi:aminoglycoside 6-adenylyltransferase [Niabella beijingensis]|uniref:aminoglycoside 6-adenylyltransferase n=1 Tax=Niabella beijingensis TaxID=2872700 RepID=UPI001CC0DFBE|nr:aminoglycoside 6-adenylyltransferase [Niabella beijingensis]MBZ4191853.1 aminoglycoside 6-adenylyltransferase [Niabella beijingensis]
MIQVAFANNVKKILEPDEQVIGLAIGGSWLESQMDEFSDLDLILITADKLSGDKDKMMSYARRLGDLLSGFTGEHVGEPRLLICLYDNPLLHVDLKFLTLEEFKTRVETPVILLDKGNRLQVILEQTSAGYPYPDHQWIEDRFWIWIHYALLKIGRGEYFEAFDFLGFLRLAVLGPLLQIRNGQLPRGVRKVETALPADDFNRLKQTLPLYDRQSLLTALHHCVALYRELRAAVFNTGVQFHHETETRVLQYFEVISNKT